MIVWTTKYGLGAKSFTFFTEPSKHLWGVPVLHVRKERPREITARARHPLDSEAEALIITIYQGIWSSRNGLYKLLELSSANWGAPKPGVAAGRGRCRRRAGVGHPQPLTFGGFLEGPVQLQVCGSRKDQVRAGATSEDGEPHEAAPEAPSTPPA